MTKVLFIALLFTTPLFAQDAEISSPAYEDLTATTEMPEQAIDSSGTGSDNVPIVTTEEATSEVISPASRIEPSVIPQDTPVMTTDIDDEYRVFEPRKSHWLTSFGFEGMKYETFNDFKGEKESFKPGDKELWGGRLGFGGEIYLGAGFVTTTKVEGYYMGTLFSRVLNGGAEDEDVKFAYTKRTGQIFGADASQALGFLFNMKTKNPFMDEWTYLTVEPYIEAGFGMAKAYNRLNYSYKLATTDERYSLRVVDDLSNAKLAAGINFTSSSGYFLYMKLIQNRFDITNRKADLLQRDNGGSTVSSKPDLGDKIDVITTYAIGGGYKF